LFDLLVAREAGNAARDASAFNQKDYWDLLAGGPTGTGW